MSGSDVLLAPATLTEIADEHTAADRECCSFLLPRVAGETACFSREP